MRIALVQGLLRFGIPVLLVPLGPCGIPGGGVARAESGDGYVGNTVCSGCHKDIYASQIHTNMAGSWVSPSSPPFSAGYTKTFAEGPAPEIRYRVAKQDEGSLSYEVRMPERQAVELPVEALIGGKRHGISFMLRVPEIEGLKLPRAPLVEARYLHLSHTGALALSPGFPEQKPATYETGLGRVLSPSFEKKCLGCHGSPIHSPVGRAGVQCENCHGPGKPHMEALENGTSGSIVNPAKLSHEQSLELCAQCHAGFSDLVDPMPQDILISNQATATKASECYIQSGKGFDCTTCHNPHRDASQGDHSATIKACRSCHESGLEKAASCPVNPKEDCVNCHMPTFQRGPFELVDHWIRVHPDKIPPGLARVRQGKSHIRPKRVFLKILVVDSRDKAEDLRKRILAGADFFELAQKNSLDASATRGGFLGEMWIDKMDPVLGAAAVRLGHGELSEALPAPTKGNFVLLERLPRDFRWDAIRLEEEATVLKAQGKLEEAVAKYQEALKLNPFFLRALVFMGVALGEEAESQRSIAVLQYAARLFPNDPSVHYNLGIAYEGARLTGEEIASYRRAIELEPDLTPAYMNLGAVLLSAGKTEEAAAVFEKAIQVNPLAASLYFNLGVARREQGRAKEAQEAFGIARKIDPNFRIAEPKSGGSQ